MTDSADEHSDDYLAPQEALDHFTKRANPTGERKVSTHRYNGRVWSVTWEDGRAVSARPLD